MSNTNVRMFRDMEQSIVDISNRIVVEKFPKDIQEQATQLKTLLAESAILLQRFDAWLVQVTREEQQAKVGVLSDDEIALILARRGASNTR